MLPQRVVELLFQREKKRKREGVGGRGRESNACKGYGLNLNSSAVENNAVKPIRGSKRT